MLNRREFLHVGLGAAIGAIGGTGIAATQPRGRRVLHAAGLLLAEDHPPPRLAPDRRPAVEYGRLESQWMGKRISYAIARPPGVDGPVPVVFGLHGRGADDSFGVEVVRFQDFLAAGAAPIAVAAVDGGPTNYWHPRRSGQNPHRMLVEEFVPLVDRQVGNGRRGLLGWSMGGYGALLAAERNPDLFAAVALASPALWRRFDDAAPGAFDDERDFRAHDVFTATDRLAGVPLRADIGRDDPFVPGFRDLRDLVPEAEFAITPGFHDAAYWRSIAPRQVNFFARHLLA